MDHRSPDQRLQEIPTTPEHVLDRGADVQRTSRASFMRALGHVDARPSDHSGFSTVPRVD
jgi:hypothetical protein